MKCLAKPTIALALIMACAPATARLDAMLQLDGAVGEVMRALDQQWSDGATRPGAVVSSTTNS